MHSQSLHERIQYLERRLRQLLAHYKEQQGALQQLRAEHEQLRQMANSTANKTPRFLNESEGWEDKLDTCIQEIDRSITYLEQLQR